MESLEEKIKKLPPDLKKEVDLFVELLLMESSNNKVKKPTLKWKGALKELKNKYTSVELQHKASSWWSE